MTQQWHGGKGSKRRLSKVSQDEIDKRWELAFGKKESEEKDKKSQKKSK